MRLILSAAMISVGLFLVCFFMTLCRNYSENEGDLFADKGSYTLISAYSSDISDIEAVDHRNISSYLGMSRSDQTVTAIGNAAADMPVFKLSAAEDNDILSERIIEGSFSADEHSVMIKKSAIEGSGLSITDVIGVQLKMSDNSGYTIAGIYDDPDSLLPDCLTACTDSNTVCDRYIIRAASLKAVPEIVSQLQKAGFTVMSHNDEIKDSLESAGTLSYVMMLFLVFSIVYVVIVFYIVIMNMLRDMYPFIAMIRAIGYRKKECLMLVFACSVYVFLFSAAMTAVMYFAGMPVIHRIFTAAEISDIYNISTDKLFQTFPYIPAAVLVVVLAGMLIADVMSAARIQKIQVNEILHEVNI